MEVQKLAGGSFGLPNVNPRPAGLHLMEIVDDMMKGLDPGRYAKKGPDGEPIPMDMVKVTGGMAFERALEHAFKPSSPGSWRPDPILVGPGIWCSPDHLDPDCLQGELVVREFKLTWYSAKKHFPTDPVYWPYLVQIKGYCHAVGTRYAILTIMYINGDYAPPTPQEPQNFGLTFTPLELQENWGMVVNHAKLKGWL